MENMIEKLIKGKYGAEFGNWPIDDAKPAIIFVHGAGGSHLMWLSELSYFRKEYHPVAVNLPGHGLSPGKGFEKISDYAEFVLGLADELKLKKFFLAGLSMGGAIAQEIALKSPARLSGLVLMSTGARLKVLPEIFKMIRENWPAYLEMFPKFAFSRNVNEAVLKLAVKDLSRREPSVVEADFRACDSFNMTEEARMISAPCLIISATLDLLTPPKYMDFLHSQIAGSRLARIEDAGHIVNLEKPKEVDQILAEFFREVLEQRNRAFLLRRQNVRA